MSLKDPEAKREYMRRWRAANPDKAKAGANRFRDKHPGYMTAYGKMYRETNRAAMKAYKQEWWQRKKAKKAALARIRAVLDSLNAHGENKPGQSGQDARLGLVGFDQRDQQFLHVQPTPGF